MTCAWDEKLEVRDVIVIRYSACAFMAFSTGGMRRPSRSSSMSR